MKPARVGYEQPRHMEEIVRLLDEHGDDAKVIAGGQSLVPMLNLRLARPEVLIDISALPDLEYIRRGPNGGRIGALTRHAVIESSPVVRRHWPVLAEGIAHVAHPQIRNRGTIGGSVSHADPSAELPTVLAALDATFTAVSVAGTRTIEWAQFFQGPFETALEPNQLLTEIQFPALPPGTGSAFTEYARRAGDYAVGGAAAVITLDENRRVTRARVVLLGAPGSPVRAHDAESVLSGVLWSKTLPTQAAEAAVADIHPTDGVHGSGEFQRRIVRAQAEAATRTAFGRAMGADR